MLALDTFKNKSEEYIHKHILAYYSDNPSYEPELNEDDDRIKEFLAKNNLLVAYEHNEGYEEWSMFIFQDKETKELSIVEASHCSCYGFEGQFQPAPVNLTCLLNKNFYSCGYYTDTIKNYIKTLIN